jgi:hypothetical protein
LLRRNGAREGQEWNHRSDQPAEKFDGRHHDWIGRRGCCYVLNGLSCRCVLSPKFRCVFPCYAE